MDADLDIMRASGLLPSWGPFGRLRLTPMFAVRFVAVATLALTALSGLLIHLVDGREFPTIGLGMWWAAQTVTTVGYGDVVPHALAGRLVALVVMCNAIAFLAVVTSAITASLVEGARNRVPSGPAAELVEIAERLERIEAALAESRKPVRGASNPALSQSPPGGVSSR